MLKASAVLGKKDSFFHEAGHLETVLGKSRRHIVTYHDTYPPGVVQPFLLPCNLKYPPQPLYQPAQFRIYTGPALTKGQAVIRFGLAEKSPVEKVKLTARMNSVDCTSMADNNDLKKFPGSARVVQFEAPLSALQNGYNLVELFLGDQSEQQRIVWVEVYLSTD